MVKKVINFQIVLVHLFGLPVFDMLYVPNLVEID